MSRHEVPSLISQEMRITGDLVSDSEIQVDGTIDGNVKAQLVIVGETAQIRGTIEAEATRVGGTVTGQIYARKVEIMKTAKVVGDLVHETLSIEAGAFFTGSVKRIDDEAPELAAGEQQVSLVQDSVPNPLSGKIRRAVNK